MNQRRPLLTVTRQKTGEEPVSNNHRAAKIRRQRGYQWEDTIVKRFNGARDWRAFRLGSPSIGLPDVLAVNTKTSTIFSIEAKSGTGTTLLVPSDQIRRCLDWIRTFDIYKRGEVLLAFKFLSKKRIGVGEYRNRELREYFKIWDEGLEINDCVCTYDGRLFVRVDGAREAVSLKECAMPFKSKQRTLVPKPARSANRF